MATVFESNECVIFIQSKKIGTHENKAIHCSWSQKDLSKLYVWLWHNKVEIHTPVAYINEYIYSFAANVADRRRHTCSRLPTLPIGDLDPLP